MRFATLLLVAIAGLETGCQGRRGPVFPEITPPIVWPPPPDQPRIAYVGELRGEASLNAAPGGWEALRAVLVGPRPHIAFSRPSAVAIAGPVVFVADTGLGVVHRLDLDARTFHWLRGSHEDPLQVPIDLLVADGQLIVVDRARAAFDFFDLAGEWDRTQRFDEVTAPVSIATDDSGRYWLLDAAAHACFQTRDWETCTRVCGGRGTGPGAFNFPSALAYHAATGLVVADAMNFRVQIFDEDAVPRVWFGQKGDAAGDFSRPRDVAMDRAGTIYVLDNQFENVQVFDHDGRMLMAFGEGGDDQKPGHFSLPSGITIDAEDRIWIADSYNRRVQVFRRLAE